MQGASVALQHSSSSHAALATQRLAVDALLALVDQQTALVRQLLSPQGGSTSADADRATLRSLSDACAYIAECSFL
jgi:hypothetical protein